MGNLYTIPSAIDSTADRWMWVEISALTWRNEDFNFGIRTFKLNNKIYRKASNEFFIELDKIRMWEKLSG